MSSLVFSNFESGILHNISNSCKQEFASQIIFFKVSLCRRYRDSVLKLQDKQVIKAINQREDARANLNVLCWMLHVTWASQVAVVLKELPASAAVVRDTGSIPGLGRSPGGGHGNPLHCPCLENLPDRGAWQATVHGAAKSQAWLQKLCTQAYISYF